MPRRRMRRDRVTLLRDDMKELIRTDGDTVVFEWQEMTGGTWNETYEVWEGGEEERKTHSIKGLGRVVDYKEDEMEYEYGRVGVGEALIRFAYDTDLSPIMGKEGIRFIYKGQRWKIDSPLGIGDTFNDNLYSIVIKGVKATD